MCVLRKFKGLNFKASKFLHRSIAPKVVVVLVETIVKQKVNLLTGMNF